MKHDEGTFEGVKGFKIYYQAWIPDEPKAVVQFVHGVTEHSGLFPHLVKDLTSNGYAMYADDHRGHGKSEGVRIYVDSFNQYIEDEKLFYDIIKSKHPELPVLMVGYSLGSLIAFQFAKKFEALIKGLVLVGTASSIKVGLITKFLLKFLALIRPRMRFGDPLAADLIYNEPTALQIYENDPLVAHEPFTIKFLNEVMKAMYFMVKNAKVLTLPLLIQCGAEDKTLEAYKAKNDDEEFKKIFTMEDKTIKIYEGLGHEIYNEFEDKRKVVLQDLTNWLNNHI